MQAVFCRGLSLGISASGERMEATMADVERLWPESGFTLSQRANLTECQVIKTSAQSGKLEFRF